MARPFFFTVDLSSVPDPELAKAQALVAFLEEGLDGVGRTLASASFEPWPAGEAAPTARPIAGHSDLYAVVLRTPAIMTDPRTHGSARDAYAAYWGSVGAELVDFCAKQFLAGGYLATRRRPWGRTYHPFVVTEAGSVFVLSGAVKDKLDGFLRTGLPLPSFAGAAPLDWQNCPYVPENGYGAIWADYLSNPEQFQKLRQVKFV